MLSFATLSKTLYYHIAHHTLTYTFNPCLLSLYLNITEHPYYPAFRSAISSCVLNQGLSAFGIMSHPDMSCSSAISSSENCLGCSSIGLILSVNMARYLPSSSVQLFATLYWWCFRAISRSWLRLARTLPVVTIFSSIFLSYNSRICLLMCSFLNIRHV